MLVECVVGMDTVSDQNGVKSEIALFFEQWEREVEAMERGLQGYAVTARHDFILQKMQEFADRNLKKLKHLDEQRMVEMEEEPEKSCPHESRGNEEDDRF